jgi:uncharacterized membrane protein
MTTLLHDPTYDIRSLPMTRPFIWLGHAWRDLLHHRLASLAYGVMVCAMGLLIFAYQRHPLYLAAAVCGFYLVGPILAAGLCELSRSSDANRTSDFDSSLDALGRNRAQLVRLALHLLAISAAWFVASYFIIQGTIGAVAPGIELTVWGDVLRHLSTQQLAAYTISLALLTAVIFALSVVTVPMVIDRHVDAHTAMLTSLRVTLKDFPVMLVWSILILALLAVGFATYLVALVVIFPLLGHATWYAYRDLVKD